MGEYLRRLVSLFISDECFSEFFVNFNLMDVDCLKQTITTTLGTGIIIGSTFVKFPQIFKIFNAKSAEGISFLGVLLELWAVTSAASYSFAKGYPFSSWGESCFLMIETVCIGFLILLYNNRSKEANMFVGLYGMIAYMLFNGIIPMSVLWSMQVANAPVATISKLIQAAKNYQSGHTGQLSAVTIFLLFLGGLARIFTSIQQTGDPAIIFTFVMSSISSGVLVAQILYYWKATTRMLMEADKKHKKAE